METCWWGMMKAKEAMPPERLLQFVQEQQRVGYESRGCAVTVTFLGLG